MRGCFTYSMNGKASPLGDPVLVALEAYSYWLPEGAPIDLRLKETGDLDRPLSDERPRTKRRPTPVTRKRERSAGAAPISCQ